MNETEDIDRPMPAMKSLGELAECRPVMIVDTREQHPLVFHHFPSVRRSLRAGDYSFLGGEEVFAVERKSVEDLVGCCVSIGRERFVWELHRLSGFHFRRILIVGARAWIEQHRYRSRVEPKVVLNSLASWEARAAVPVVWCADAEQAAETVERWAWWMMRTIVERANELRRAMRETKTGSEHEKGDSRHGEGKNKREQIAAKRDCRANG